MAGSDDVTSLEEGIKGLQIEKDILLRELMVNLTNSGMISTRDHIIIRKKILQQLEDLVVNWAKELCLNRGMPKKYLKKVTVKILPFGSYQMGVHWHGADLDALCIAPRFIKRHDFFNSFIYLLRKQKYIADVVPVEDSFCPVIKMICHGIEVDMVFASLDLDCIPANLDLRNDRLLYNLDISCIRSLHGFRVTAEILNLVPNLKNFQTLLRVIKLWAKRRGIYSNAMGMLGGVAYAILVAYICIQHPEDDVISLIYNFFATFVNWGWHAPEPAPIKLKNISNYDDHSISVWDPNQNVLDRFDRMPIITPSFPEKNCAYNVTLSSQKIILVELQIGLSKLEEILIYNLSWSSLFQSLDFFNEYKHFLVVMARSCSKDHKAWAGLIEAKIRILVNNLDQSEKIDYVRVLPKVYSVIGEEHRFTKWYLAMKILKARAPAASPHILNLTYDITNFQNVVLSSAERLKEFTDDMTIEVISLRRSKKIIANFIKNYLPPDVIDLVSKNSIIQESSLRNNEFDRNNQKICDTKEDNELADMESPQPVSYMNQNKLLQLKLSTLSKPTEFSS